MIVKDQQSETSLGEILKNARLKTGLQIEEVSKKTKIPCYVIKSLEKNEQLKFIPFVYLRAILTKYAIFLKIDTQEIIEKYQEENDKFLESNNKNKLFNHKDSFFLNQKKIFKNLFGVSLSFFILLLITIFIGGYFLYELADLFLPPRIIVYNTQREMTVFNSPITFQGRIVRGESLYINNNRVFFRNNKFTEDIWLNPGINNIEFKAINKLGQESVVRKRILYSQE